MKAVFIDAANKEVRAVETDGELESMYRLLDCRVVEVVRLEMPDAHDRMVEVDVWVDEEGLLVGKRQGWQLLGSHVMGHGLALGHTPDGESRDCPVGADAIAALITFFEF